MLFYRSLQPPRTGWRDRLAACFSAAADLPPTTSHCLPFHTPQVMCPCFAYRKSCDHMNEGLSHNNVADVQPHSPGYGYRDNNVAIYLRSLCTHRKMWTTCLRRVASWFQRSYSILAHLHKVNASILQRKDMLCSWISRVTATWTTNEAFKTDTFWSGYLYAVENMANRALVRSLTLARITFPIIEHGKEVADQFH